MSWTGSWGIRSVRSLWAKIKRGLSAGRVQSVALRLICDREEEINAFIPEEYWSLDAFLNVKGSKKPLEAKFAGDKDGKIEIKKEEQLNKTPCGIWKEPNFMSTE